MNITAEEKLMYKVMKAIYDSGIPISFKGSMVLKACLLEAGYSEETRHTVDMVANWNSDAPPSAEQMTDSLQRAIEKSGIDLEVSIYRMYGEERSAGFELTERSTGEILFSMDIDVNRPVPPTKIYGAEGLRSTDKVFRSVKDVVDLYYISKVFDLGRADIMQTLKNGGRTLGNFHGFLHRAEELGHSYEKFRFAGGVNKPPFDEVYRTVKSYIKDVLPREKERDYER